VPPLLGRWTFADKWRVALMLPAGVRANGAYERRFFEENTPLPRIEVLETMAIMYHGIVPSFVTQNYDDLKRSLIELHKVGFKKREVNGQSELVQKCLAYLHTNCPFPVGMSSMGPLLYAIVENDDSNAETFLRTMSREFGIQFIGTFNGWNSPHEVQKE
jgi:beta-ribofuranosylaminobenzene 5'-phosphate synthase